METYLVVKSSEKGLSDIEFRNEYIEDLRAFYDKVAQSKNILLISHQKPDGDTSGSAMAMAYILESFGKKITLFSEDSLAEEFYFIPKSSDYQQSIDISQYDLAIAFDGGTYKMFGLHEKFPELFNKSFPLINIDHHLSNEQYGMINFVIPSVASTTIMVAKLFRALQWKITPQIATCLLMGLYTDTGGLMHSNSTAETFSEASLLLRAGGDLKSIVKYIFRTKKINRLKLWGKVLSRAVKTPNNVVTSFVRMSDYESTNTTPDDLTGVVDYLNAVPNSQYSNLLTERNGGKVKGSLRTLRDDVDLNQIAGSLGGGGHKKASGFTLEGNLEIGFDWFVKSKNGEILVLR